MRVMSVMTSKSMRVCNDVKVYARSWIGYQWESCLWWHQSLSTSVMMLKSMRVHGYDINESSVCDGIKVYARLWWHQNYACPWYISVRVVSVMTLKSMHVRSYQWQYSLLSPCWLLRFSALVIMVKGRFSQKSARDSIYRVQKLPCWLLRISAFVIVVQGTNSEKTARDSIYQIE